MEKKYINENRYKKNNSGNSRKRRGANTVKSNLNKTSTNSISAEKKQVKKPKAKTKTKTNTKKNKTKIKVNKKANKHLGIIVGIILLVIVAVISRLILKEEQEPFIPEIFTATENEQEVTIGIISTEDLTDVNTSNLILTELNKYSKDILLVVNEDYTVTYKVLSNVEKVSNKEYVLTKNKDSKVEASDIKASLENYMKDKDSIYYTKLSNVQSITVLNEETLNIKLKKDDPYFIYNLDINLTTILDTTSYIRDESTTKNQLILTRSRKANKEIPYKITVNKYKDMYAAVEAYKEGIVDVVITNAQNVENILGKYEYNIKTCRSGETLFLFGNSASKLFADKQIRQVIAYSINRDNIIQTVLKSQGEKIDLPYVYDNIKYKYDVYAAENILLTNGYTKKNKVYYKTQNGKTTKLELDLIVNKSDSEKIQVANIIKNNLSSIGISVNVEKLSQTKLEKRIKNKDYDLILATVNLNNNPNIEFVNSNLYLTENIKKAQEQILNSSVQDLPTNIGLLQAALSEDISVVGIYSKDLYVIYNKEISNMDNISYLNIFKSLFN